MRFAQLAQLTQLTLLALLTFLPAQATHAALPAHAKAPVCSSQIVNGFTINFCYDQGDETSTEVVYYFHGIGFNETYWNTSGLRASLNAELEANPAKPRPHVISLSFGRAWFFSDELWRRKSGSRIQAFFDSMADFEPRITLTKRTLVGESMGGYNALRLAFENPALFNQVVALCPALIPVGPYSSDEEIAAFQARNPHIDPIRLRAVRLWAKMEFSDHASWQRNNPLDRSYLPLPALPPIFLSQYLLDQYGFAEGTTAFANNLGPLATLRTVDAPHCRHPKDIFAEAAKIILAP